jgi:beta-phosphoglucomutase-like phosphatase (HAD superfamily)
LALNKLKIKQNNAPAIDDSVQDLIAAKGAGLKVLITAKAKPGLESADRIVDDHDGAGVDLAQLKLPIV